MFVYLTVYDDTMRCEVSGVEPGTSSYTNSLHNPFILSFTEYNSMMLGFASRVSLSAHSSKMWVHRMSHPLQFICSYLLLSTMRCEACRVAMGSCLTHWTHPFTFPAFSHKPLSNRVFDVPHIPSSISASPHSLLPSFSRHFPYLLSPLVEHSPCSAYRRVVLVFLARSGRYQQGQFTSDPKPFPLFNSSAGIVVPKVLRSVLFR
jgi:hypothetical protein